MLAACPGRPKGSAKLTVTALRSLLGFLHVDGQIGEPLGQAVSSVASWSLAGLPRALEPGQVAALLASCDRDTGTGCRDFAMLTLLALGTFVAGLQAHAWRICAVGGILFVAAPGVGWLDQSPMLLVAVAGLIIALGGLAWWFKDGGKGAFVAVTSSR